MLVGLDGWKKQWVGVFEVDGIVHAEVVPLDFRSRLSDASVICVDTPIGLPDADSRTADQEARSFVGRRRSSVFPAPLRGVLYCETYEEANALSKRIHAREKGLSKQAFMICPVIRAVDEVVRSSPHWAKVVYEVHPEVCFRAMNGADPEAKASFAGSVKRRELVARDFGPDAFPEALKQLGNRTSLETDLLDAFACLWTARRIRDGMARTLPDPPEVDSAGVRMAIWY